MTGWMLAAALAFTLIVGVVIGLVAASVGWQRRNRRVNTAIQEHLRRIAGRSAP